VIEHMHSSGGYSPEDFLRVENGGGGSTVLVQPAAPTAPSPPPPPSPIHVPAAADSEGVWSEADFLPPGEFVPLHFVFVFLCRTQEKNLKVHFLCVILYQIRCSPHVGGSQRQQYDTITYLISCPSPLFDPSSHRSRALKGLRICLLVLVREEI
jgi:hypothetical protein